MKTLIVITGATGSGKTELALSLAETLGCQIISADSRQIFRDIPIGTAAPTAEEMARVPHHFVGILPLDAYYSAAEFEADVLKLLPDLWKTNDYAIMCGGSMMYIDAVCNGLDDIPRVSDLNRQRAWALYQDEGLEALQKAVKEADPKYFARADVNNHRRLIHALEVTMEAGVPYSSLTTGRRCKRPFRILKIAIDMPREELFNRINTRVDRMMERGWEAEARSVYHLRHLNSLNTVGYKELFAMFDGVMDRETTLARIAKNTRVYAKKQLTWLKRDPDVNMLSASESMISRALELIR